MAHWTETQPYPVRTEEEFVAFLDQVGVCLWRPDPAADLPNLADRMEPARPDAIWDTWFWKDDLHIARRLYYGKLLGGRPTFVSMEMLPALIAAQGDVDPHTLREQGRISSAALAVYEALCRCRTLAVRDLRREAGLGGASDKAAFEAGLQALSALFQICKVGITGRSRGTYGYIWGLVEEWLPDTLALAARLRPDDAAVTVARRLAQCGAPQRQRIYERWFGWPRDRAEAAVRAMPT